MKRLFTSLCILAVAFLGTATVASAQAIYYLDEDFASASSGSMTEASNVKWKGNTNFPKAGLGSAYHAGGAIKLGVAKSTGHITSKTLDLSQYGGNFIISFDVKGWGAKEPAGGDQPCKLTVSVTGQENQTVNYTAGRNSSFEHITLYYTGGQADAEVIFSTVNETGVDKRAFLDNIKIYPAYKVEMSDVKHATFASQHPYILPEGLTASTVQVNGGKATLQEVLITNKAAAGNQGLLLQGEPATYYLQVAENGDNFTSTNSLKPALSNDEITEAGHKLYILANDPTDGLGFYYQGVGTDGSKVSNIAGKAYLSVEAASAPTQGFSLSGIVSGIDHLAPATLERQDIYDLSGRRVSTPTKGLYIINGKKVIR